MILQKKQLLKSIENIFVLILFSCLLWNPVGIKADNEDDEIELSGIVQVKTDSSITVNSVEVLVNSSTKITNYMQGIIIFDSLKVGSFVQVEVYSNQRGTLVASLIKLMNANSTMELEGMITAISSSSFTVNGTEVFVDSTTVIYTKYNAALKFSELKVGDKVYVRVSQQNNGTYLAVSVMVDTKYSRREFEFEGTVQEVTSNSIKILDKVFFVDSTTVILKEETGIMKLSEIMVGDKVAIRGFLRADSTYLALMIKVESESHPQKVLELEGSITAISSDSFVVNGFTRYVDSSTVFFADEGTMLSFSDLKVGDRVEVKALLQTNGTYKALKVQLENDFSRKEFELEGLIQAVSTDNITVGGYTIYVNSQTKIYNQFKQSISFGDLTVGAYVKIKAYMQNSNYYASYIKVKDNSKTEFHFTGSIDSINGTTLTVKGTVFTIDQNTEFYDNNRNTITINDLKVGQIVSVQAVVQGPNQYYAVQVKINDYWRPFIVVEGTIDALTTNSLTVSNKTFVVDTTTIIKGSEGSIITFLDLTLGIKVEVKGVLDANGNLIAKLIKVHSNNEFEVYGKIDSLGTDYLVVAGLTLTTDQNTVYYDEFGRTATFDSLKVNQYVEVKYTKTAFNTNLAVRVEIESKPNSVMFSGVVTSSTSTTLQLSVPSFSISSSTVFISSLFTQIQSSSIQSGQTVTVWASQSQNGNLQAVQVQQISGSVTSVNNGNKEGLPATFELKQNFPNPFNPSTNISFTLAKTENVTLKVFNVIGQEVATLINGQMNAGSHLVTFNAVNLASGIYFYQLKTGSLVAIKKMVLLK